MTGRPRRCGWFDAVAARYSATINGVDELAVMLLDVLSEVDEIKICTAYRLDGDTSGLVPRRCVSAGEVQPMYETLPGWRKDVSGAQRLADLPAAARRYVDRLAELLEKPVTIVSVGPDRAIRRCSPDSTQLPSSRLGIAHRKLCFPSPASIRERGRPPAQLAATRSCSFAPVRSQAELGNAPSDRERYQVCRTADLA